MRASFLLAAVLAAGPAAAKPLETLPKPNEIFPRLLADPRAVQLSGAYYRSEGRDLGDIGLGHAWGLSRGRLGGDLSWLSELDVEGMAYSRFALSGGRRELEAVDFLAALPFTTRRGDVSFKASLFHESSHLGDDYIRRTGRAGFRSSAQGLRALAALEPWERLRLYGGAGVLLHRVPAYGRWELRFGAELTSRELDWEAGPPTRLYAALDAQSRGRSKHNLDVRTLAGARLGREQAARAQVGYFVGHSPFGQFYARPEHRFELSVVFEL